MFKIPFLDLPPLRGAAGTVRLPGSKSISNRVLLLAALSEGRTIVRDLLASDERRILPAETLSDREIGCLQMAGDGYISEEIAEKLGLSVHTVNAYLGTATTKLDSVNRIQAIAKAIRLGYIS